MEKQRLRRHRRPNVIGKQQLKAVFLQNFRARPSLSWLAGAPPARTRPDPDWIRAARPPTAVLWCRPLARPRDSLRLATLRTIATPPTLLVRYNAGHHHPQDAP